MASISSRLDKLEAQAAALTDVTPEPEIDPIAVQAAAFDRYLDFVRGWLSEVDRVVSEYVTSEQAHTRQMYQHNPALAVPHLTGLDDIVTAWAALRGCVVSLDSSDRQAARDHARAFVRLAWEHPGGWIDFLGSYCYHLRGVDPIAGFSPPDTAELFRERVQMVAVLVARLSHFADTGNLTPRDTSEAEYLLTVELYYHDYQQLNRKSNQLADMYRRRDDNGRVGTVEAIRELKPRVCLWRALVEHTRALAVGDNRTAARWAARAHRMVARL